MLPIIFPLSLSKSEGKEKRDKKSNERDKVDVTRGKEYYLDDPYDGEV